MKETLFRAEYHLKVLYNKFVLMYHCVTTINDNPLCQTSVISISLYPPI